MHPTADPGGVGSEPNCHHRGAAGSGAPAARPPASAHGDGAKGAVWLPSPWCLRAGEKRTISKANKQQRGMGLVGAPRCLQISSCAVPEQSQPETRGLGSRKSPSPHGGGEAAMQENFPPKLRFLKGIPSWKRQREAVQLDTALLPRPSSNGQEAWGCPRLIHPACIFRLFRAHRALRFSREAEQSTPLSSAPRAGDAGSRYLTQTNISSSRHGSFRVSTCQAGPDSLHHLLPGALTGPVLVHGENTRGLVWTRRALTPARGCDPTPSRRSQPRPNRKALTWKAAVMTLIPLNNVHFHIHQKMVK